METITYLKSDNTDREGNQLMSKAGKPYTRLTLKVESKGDRFISGFENAQTKEWRVGDEVDIIITESDKKDKNGNPYLNWSLPKKEAVSNDLLKQIADDQFKILARLGGLINDIRIIMDYTVPKKNGATYPTRADEGMSEEDPF